MIIANPAPDANDEKASISAAACRRRTSIASRLYVQRRAAVDDYDRPFQAAVTSAMSATAGSRMADGVREKRGAGAGWVTP